MELGIEGRTALVLGAGGGLGGAIARALARGGANLALGDISSSGLEATKQAVEQHGVKAFALDWDLSRLELIDQRVTAIEEALGSIEILICVTGGPPPTPVAEQASTTWTQHFESMVLSVIKISDRVVPGMRARGWGRVVVSTSSGVIAPIPNLGLSNTLRSSLHGWSKTLAGEVGADGVTVNVVVPGRIATPRIAHLDQARAERENRSIEDVITASTSSIAVHRYGKPDEYGDVVSFLASERASYVTGSVVRVDGGLIPSI